MIRALLVIAFAAGALPAHAEGSSSSLTRIEPRPYYGAVVTVEHGVRVYRSLPPHREVVIAPPGSAAINLNYVNDPHSEDRGGPILLPRDAD